MLASPGMILSEPLARLSRVLEPPQAIGGQLLVDAGGEALGAPGSVCGAVMAFCAGLWVSNPRSAHGLGADCEGEPFASCLHGGGTALQRSCRRL